YTPHAHIYRTPTLKYINTHPKPPHHLIPDTHLTFINKPRAPEAGMAERSRGPEARCHGR
ncbi:MAG: hypothetical protein J6C95_01420, partial [Muribaculaceae bacterium]|nr:hypothetical protein [Muribaculaceae bacterium]